MELIYNDETREWEEKPEPFITIECETEEDFEFIGAAVSFYQKHLEDQEKPQTNADRIRAMSDEELAKWLNSFGGDFFCIHKKECLELVDSDQDIPEELCMGCLMEWLQQPAQDQKDG